MAGIFRDGFDAYSGTGTTVGLGTKYTVVNTPNLVTGRFGGQAVQLVANSITAPLDSAVSSLTVHCGIFCSGYATTTSPRIAIGFLSGTTYTLCIMIGQSGELIVYRLTAIGTGVELGRTATGIISLSTWYSLAAEIVINDSTGRVTIDIDDVEVLNLTGVDTNNAVGTVNNIQIGAGNLSSSATFSLDDLYVTDSATRLTNHPRIQTLVPNSDGGTLNLVPSTGTSHFAVVDELPASATDYLSGSTVGDLDILGLTNLSATPLSVEEVNVVGFLQKTDAAARSMALGVISGPTTSDGPNYALVSSGDRHERPLATDPNTSAAWTESGVNALNLQPKVTV